MKVQCPAKINLFFEVTGRRKDGYHNVATLFAKIHLYDVLDLEAAPGSGVELSVAHGAGLPEIPSGGGNLIARAAGLFLRHFDIAAKVSIALDKRIPVGAGLGGGSSDAAGTLLGLAKIFDLPLDARTRKALHALGRELGADVPFFLQSGAFALGRGVGDRLKAVPIEPVLPYLILAYPSVAVSTAQAYKALPQAPRSDVLTRLSQLDKLLKSLKNGRPVEEWAGLLFNRLEESRVPEMETVGQTRKILEKLGLRGVRMSGSGSSVFGFVSSYEEGRRCVERLSGYPWKVYLTSLSG